MSRIELVRGREILDSRGRPTVEAEVALADGTHSHASVPSGASVGASEALELRDGDASRYRGLGVLRAVANVNETIGPALVGLDAREQSKIDGRLLEVDGTADKSRLGANALLAVSLAAARAAAVSAGVPLWRYLARERDVVLPVPMVNVVSGGLHARQNLDFQDFLIVPIGAETYSQALELAVAVHAATADLLAASGLSTLKADEGGFGPVLQRNRDALDLLVAAIERAGLAPGDDVAIALDVAASHFFELDSGRYHLTSEARSLSAAELIEMLVELVESYPLISIEDGVAEEDWDGWRSLTQGLGDSVQLVGDDLFATNPARLRRGIEQGVANAILVKMNQIGTLTETLAVVEQARQAGYRQIVSARSGETEDSFLADLAVATAAGQIKIGSLAQSERLAKYNQLLRIEEELGTNARFPGREALTLVR